MRHVTEISRDETAPRTARRAVDALRGSVDDDLLPKAQLLVSELVTNSVRHGEGDRVQLVLDVRGERRLRCEIVDQGHGFVPTARTLPKDAKGGWGLHLVETLSDQWGVHEGSTHVWFELSA